jgi:hypothetical protein
MNTTGADRAAYVHGLRSVLRPGGRYFMLCYIDAQPDVPHRVSLGDTLAAFTTGVRGWLAALTRTNEDPPC